MQQVFLLSGHSIAVGGTTHVGQVIDQDGNTGAKYALDFLYGMRLLRALRSR